MTLATFTYPESLALLDQVIHAKGPTHITRAVCRYFSDGGEPLCVIGHVLDRVGVTRTMLDDETCGGNSVTFAVLVRDGYFEADEETVRLYDRAQGAQDEGKPWGTARDHAVNMIGVPLAYV